MNGTKMKTKSEVVKAGMELQGFNADTFATRLWMFEFGVSSACVADDKVIYDAAKIRNEHPQLSAREVFNSAFRIVVQNCPTNDGANGKAVAFFDMLATRNNRQIVVA